ncbi:unnamed protein product [Scytosiphon promiscuus]
MAALEELSYRELQTLAKENGVKANGSKEDLKTRVAAALLLMHDDLHTKLTGESSWLRGKPDAIATVDELGVCCRASDGIPDTDTKVAGERTRDNSAASQPRHIVDNEAQDGEAQPGKVPSEVSQGLTSVRLFANKVKVMDHKLELESREVDTSIEAESDAANRDPIETKVKKPKAGPGLRFQRMHQTLFAGQTSIERYGKTPKKPASTKENMLMHKNQRFTPRSSRPAASGSGIKSTKRGVTVASKPPTLVVQRSTKKPTKVMEFQLSGKREPFTFRPYSGPVRPITPASKTASFSVGHHPKHAPDYSGPKGIKATLASGRSRVSRRSEKMESSKAGREKKVQAQRRAGW